MTATQIEKNVEQINYGNLLNLKPCNLVIGLIISIFLLLLVN